VPQEPAEAEDGTTKTSRDQPSRPPRIIWIRARMAKAHTDGDESDRQHEGREENFHGRSHIRPKEVD
jgi:hypothetical protein